MSERALLLKRSALLITLLGILPDAVAADGAVTKSEVARRRPPSVADSVDLARLAARAAEQAAGEAARVASLAAKVPQAPDLQTLAESTVVPPEETLFSHPGVTVLVSRTRGKVECHSPDPDNPRDLKLRELQVSVNDQPATTDEDGEFEFLGLASGDSVSITIWYEGTITAPDGDPATPLQVMDDVHETRSERVDRIVLGTGVGQTLETIRLDSVDCELWRIGSNAVRDYHTEMDASPPAGRLRIKRWGGVIVGGAHTFYDYVAVETDFLTETPKRADREKTIFHEFGHSLRHAADGSQAHWDLDNFRWAYGRDHRGAEISNVHYAFNEGFAKYWSVARLNKSTRYGSTLSADHRFWVENLVANALLELAEDAGVDDWEIMKTLEENPGTIHSLWEFEERFAAARGLPAPSPQPECPPNFRDDGLLCASQDVHIAGKPTETRGAGEIPSECQLGEEKDGALCYPNCNSGYSGAGPVCWKQCAAGYKDDGAFCRRDVRIINADNSGCPIYDLCGLTLKKGCSKCPAGFQNDGCTCRIDVHIYPKDTYTRGAGSPMVCGPGLESDAGLCYPPCPGTLTPAGPVCWGSCPDGYWDHGATCYKGVIVK